MTDLTAVNMLAHASLACHQRDNGLPVERSWTAVPAADRCIGHRLLYVQACDDDMTVADVAAHFDPSPELDAWRARQTKGIL